MRLLARKSKKPLFGKKADKQELKVPANLSKQQQKEVQAVIKKAKRDNGVPHTAQQSIPSYLDAISLAERTLRKA